MNDAGDDWLRLELAQALFYTAPNGKRVFRWADPVIALEEDPHLPGMLDALLPRIREYAAQRTEKAEATIESLRGEHTRGSGDHSSFCAGCDRIWPCPTIWLIDRERP